jgi:succinate dehydrogenase / fumarate reductase cytochrome b subunit
MKNRPLAPHLLIYKTQITSIISIFHRISGSCLGLSLILLNLIFYFDSCFSEFYTCYNQGLSLQFYLYWLFVCFAYIVFNFLFFHIANGVRHLIWDLVFGLTSQAVVTTGLFVLIFSLLALFLILL